MIIVIGSDISKLYVTASHQPGYTLVTAFGAITRSTVIQLRNTLLHALARAGPQLILDLSTVDHIDDIGLEALRRTAIRAQLQGGQLQLLAPSSDLAERIHTYGLTQHLSIRADLDAATAVARPPFCSRPVLPGERNTS